MLNLATFCNMHMAQCRQLIFASGILLGGYPCLPALAQPGLGIGNPFDVPIDSVALEIGGAAVYGQLGVSAGTPLRIVTERNDEIPVRWDAARGCLVLHVALAPRERISAGFHPTPTWQPESAFLAATWDQAAKRGSLSNRLIRVQYDEDRTRVEYEDPLTGRSGRSILDRLEFKGWMGDADSGQVTRERAAALGLTRINLQSRDIVGGRARVANGRAELVVIRKSDEGFLSGMVFEEVISLFLGEPRLEYRLRIRNDAGANRYLANGSGRESEIFGAYGEILRSDRMFLRRDSVRESSAPSLEVLENGGVTSSNLKPSQGWDRRMAHVTTPSGHGLGTTMIMDQALSPQWHRWHIGLESFGMVATTRESALPIRIAPGETIEIGGAIVPTPPGSDALEGMRQIHDAYMTGGEFPHLGSAVVLLNGKPVAAPLLSRLDDDMSDLYRWYPSTGAIEQVDGGLRLRASEGGRASAVLPVTMRLPESGEAFIEVAAVDPEARVGLSVRGLDSSELPISIMEHATPGSWRVRLNPDVLSALRKEALLELVVTGPSGASARVDHVRVQEAVRTPVIIAPADDAELTDVATSFVWELERGISRHWIQVSRDEAFHDLVFDGKTRLPRQHRMDGNSHYPAEPLRAGSYFWRMRAETSDGAASEWTLPRRLRINAGHTTRRPILEISPQRPRILLDTWKVEDISVFRGSFPDDLKPHLAFAPTALPHTVVPERSLRASAEMGIPYLMQGWTPLCQLEEIFQEYENVPGVWWGEEFGDWDRYRRLVTLCAKYGRYVIFFDGDRTSFPWLQRYGDRELAAFLRTYREYLVFGHKTNNSELALLVMSEHQGAWLDGLMGNLGMHFEAFYWDHAGYRIEPDKYYGFRGGRANLMPPNFWNQQLMVAISQGAAVLSIGGQGNTTLERYDPAKHPEFWLDPEGAALEPGKRWTALFDREGKMTPVWHRFVLPFLRGMLRHSMIPSEPEVRAAARIAVVVDPPARTDALYPSEFARFDALYRATYGISPNGGTHNELIPNTGRFYWIPVVPPGSAGLAGAANVPLSQLNTPETVSKRFAAAFPDTCASQAWTARIGDRFFISNSSENGSKREVFLTCLDAPVATSLGGEIGPHQYVMGRLERGGRRLWLQTNTEYPAQPFELLVRGRVKPAVQAIPAHSLQSATWDAAAGELRIRVSNRDGAAEILLDAP